MLCSFSHTVIIYCRFKKTQSSWKCRMFILKLNSDTSGTQLFHYTNFFKVMLWYTHSEASKRFVKEDLLLLCHQKCTWRIKVKLSKTHICVKDTAAKKAVPSWSQETRNQSKHALQYASCFQIRGKILHKQHSLYRRQWTFWNFQGEGYQSSKSTVSLDVGALMFSIPERCST